MKFYVYILQSQKDLKYYIGFTTDLEKRVEYHNCGRQRATKKRIPFNLIYNEGFKSKKEALKREKQIKSFKGGKAFKALIKGV
jgi:putative endonuclease